MVGGNSPRPRLVSTVNDAIGSRPRGLQISEESIELAWIGGGIDVRQSHICEALEILTFDADVRDPARDADAPGQPVVCFKERVGVSFQLQVGCERLDRLCSRRRD